MSLKNIRFNGADTTYGPSDSVWGRLPIDAIKAGEIPGIFHRWEFSDFRTSTNVNAAEAYWAKGLKVFGSNGAPIAAVDAIGGGITIGSDGDNEGLSLGQMVYPFQLDQDKGRLAFEIRLKTSTIADTKHGIFAGLIDSSALSATVPIAADGTLADQNFVGFHRLEGDGLHVDTVYKANGVTQVSVQTDAITLVADTYVKLGLLFEPFGDKAGNYCVSFYKDGVRLSTSKLIPDADGTDFPNDVRLGFVLAVLNATASTPGTVAVQWAQVGQLLDQ